MNPYLKALLITIGLMTLMNLQLCLLAYEQYSQFNPLLILYLYILLTNCSVTMLTALTIMLDIITYIITGITGLSVLFLVPASWLALKIKNDMYNKIVIPGLFILLYAIFYNIILATTLQPSLRIITPMLHIIWSTIQNYIAFICLWRLCKQPFHD